MSSPSDLTPVLTAAYTPASDIGFHQGVVVAWDETLGTNTVNVAGTLLDNLPCLNIGEFVILQPDDIVGILRFQHTYFILGRIILPAGPDTNRASVAFERASAETDDAFAIGTTPTVRATITLTPPDWADEALVMVGIMGQAFNDTGVPAPVPEYLSVQAKVNGISLKGMNALVPVGVGAGATSIDSALIAPVTGPITVQGLSWNSGPDTFLSSTSNDLSLTALAVYRRVN